MYHNMDIGLVPVWYIFNMIDAVILYSTNDHRFFKSCITNLLTCGIRTHVVTYTRMWNGTPENIELQQSTNELFSDNSNYFQYLIEWTEGQSPSYWEGLGRYLATQELEGDYVLYIDIDEIVDSTQFTQFLNANIHTKYDAVKLSNYWYFREPTYRAQQLEDSVVLCKTSLAKNVPLQVGGRELYFNFPSTANMLGKESPFIHHYSWVRTKDEMLNKVKNWGHSSERNWVALVEEEFSRPFNGTDFIHGYKFIVVDNIFGISL